MIEEKQVDDFSTEKMKLVFGLIASALTHFEKMILSGEMVPPPTPQEVMQAMYREDSRVYLMARHLLDSLMAAVLADDLDDIVGKMELLKKSRIQKRNHAKNN